MGCAIPIDLAWPAKLFALKTSNATLAMNFNTAMTVIASTEWTSHLSVNVLGCYNSDQSLGVLRGHQSNKDSETVLPAERSTEQTTQQ